MKRFSFKNWYAYLVLGLVCLVAIPWEYKLLLRPKDHEKIDIFVTEIIKNETSFNEYLNSIENNYLKEIDYRYIDPTSNLFGQNFSTYGVIDADIFILNSETIKNLNSDHQFLNLDENYLENETQKDLNFYISQNNTFIGVKINETYFENVTQDLYMLFNKTTLHMGELSNTNLDGDIQILKLFI